MSTPQAGLRDYALLFFLALIWGSSFLLIKITVDQVGPISLTLIRLCIASLALLLIARLLGEKLPSAGRHWRFIFASALIGNALPFSLINWGETVIDSALAAVLMAIMPLVTILIAHFYTQDEKLNRWRVLGVACGFVALLIIFGPTTLSHLGEQLLPQLAVLCAACCYGVNTMFSKRLSHLPKFSLCAALMMVSTLIMLPATLLWESPRELLNIDQQHALTIVILGLAHTAGATVLMLIIIGRQGAGFFAQINYLVPVVGLFFGILFLQEDLGKNVYFALGLILLGIAITRYGQKQNINRVKP